MKKRAAHRIHIVAQTHATSYSVAWIRRVARATLQKYSSKPMLAVITLTTDQGIRTVHRRFLGASKITDVISFDLSDQFESNRRIDVVVNADLAKRQAALRRIRFVSELGLYVVHGLLHQLGFDDQTARQAARMHRVENSILIECGLEPAF